MPRVMLSMILIAAASTAAFGQPPAPVVSVAAGPMLSTQQGHRPGSSPSFPRTGTGGTALGVAGQLLFTPRGAPPIAVEVSLPARFTSIQETDYFSTFRERNRHTELLMSALVDLPLVKRGGFSLSGALGGGLVRESTLQRETERLGFMADPSRLDVFLPPDVSISRWTWAVVVGGDAAVRLSPRVALVPQLRVYVARRSTDTEQASLFLGLNNTVWRPAVLIRVGP